MSSQTKQEGLRALPSLWPWGALAMFFAVLAVSVGASGWVAYPPLLLVFAIGLFLFFFAVIVGAQRARRMVPAGCIAAAIVVSGLSGGLGMHLVPVFAVLCAGMLLAGTTGQAPRLTWLFAAAGAAGVLSLAFAAAVIKPRPGVAGGSASDLGSGSTSSGPGPEPATFQRLVDAVLRALGLGDEGEGSGSEEVPGGGLRLGEPDDPTNWWPLLALLVTLIVLAVATWLLIRWLARRGGTSGGLATWSLIERFEAVGKQAGARRRPDQGLVDYGHRLSAPDDRRPGQAGLSLSGLLYDPAAHDEGTAQRLLIDLESRPPPAVEEPSAWWRRFVSRRRNRP